MIPREPTVREKKAEFRLRCKEMQERKMMAQYCNDISMVEDKVCVKIRDKMTELGYLGVGYKLEQARQAKIKMSSK